MTCVQSSRRALLCMHVATSTRDARERALGIAAIALPARGLQVHMPMRSNRCSVSCFLHRLHVPVRSGSDFARVCCPKEFRALGAFHASGHLPESSQALPSCTAEHTGACAVHFHTTCNTRERIAIARAAHPQSQHKHCMQGPASNKL